MWLNKLASVISRVAGKVSLVLHGIAMTVLVVMMLLTATDVILRKAVNRPIIGSFELTEFMMSVVVSFGLAYCCVLGRNVVIDLVVGRFAKRTQIFFDVVVSFIGFILICLIAWQSAEQSAILFNSKLTSGVLLIPVFPFPAFVAFGLALLAVALLANFLESLLKVVMEKWS